MYRPKKGKTFYYNIKYMQFLLYYPTADGEQNMKETTIKFAILKILGAFAWIGSLLHIIVVIKNKIPVNIIEDCAIITGVANSMYICIMFFIISGKWSDLMRHVLDFSKFGKPQELAKRVNNATAYCLGFNVFYHVGMFIYLAASMLKERECAELNVEKGIHEICGTMVPLWWPNDDIHPYSKFGVCIWQFYSATCYVPSSGVVVFIIWEATEIIVAKIHHLRQLFEEMFDTKKYDEQRIKFNFCVQYHQHIISLCEEINIITKINMGQFSIVSAVIMSWIGTQILKEYSPGALVHLTGYVITGFLICQCGQKLNDETLNIRDSVYASKWYNVRQDLVKDCQFVIFRCEKQAFLEAVPFGKFDFTLFVIILKTTYSYLTLINQTSTS